MLRVLVRRAVAKAHIMACAARGGTYQIWQVAGCVRMRLCSGWRHVARLKALGCWLGTRVLCAHAVAGVCAAMRVGLAVCVRRRCACQIWQVKD